MAILEAQIGDRLENPRRPDKIGIVVELLPDHFVRVQWPPARFASGYRHSTLDLRRVVHWSDPRKGLKFWRLVKP